jgi:prepilin-type N-terminal cleavage/methylation domain-containing protein
VASRSSRRAFTLVELLITITIISILASLILGVASVAGETARHRKTEQMIARLHTLLMEHYDTYKTRRVAVRPEITSGINNQNISAAQKGQMMALARLYALRELILMEVPDRWSDVLLTDVPKNPGGFRDAYFPFFQDTAQASPTTGRTALADVYLRRYAAIATGNNSLTGQRNTAEEITDNQGAECLYLVITLATGDGEARTMFGESTIGDTDGDGAKEFLDGWEHPINFLRWAPGFDSQIQLDTSELSVMSPIDRAAAITNDHDPFDVYRIDEQAYRLVPLIFSAGPDETFGIRLVKPHVALRGVRNNKQGGQVNPNTWLSIRPWPYTLSEADDDGQQVYLGVDSGEGASTDNIHNHLLGDR